MAGGTESDKGGNDVVDVGSLTDLSGAPADKPPPAAEAAVPPVKGTAVSLLASGLIGVAASAAFFGLLWIGLGHENKLYLFFWRSVWVPYFSTLLFCWAVAILFLKIKHIRREQSAFGLGLLPTDPYQLLTTREVQSTLRTINGMPAGQKDMILVTRIGRALRRVRASGNSNEVADFLEYQANIDSGATESTYAAVKIFIWAIPVIGFIGTVQGISNSIGGFGSLVQTAGDVDQIKQGLGGVTGNLAVAFDTTLLALVYSIIVMFFSTYIRKKEDDFQTEVEDYCVENLLNKLSIGDDKLVAELNEALIEAQDEGMQRQAAIVERALAELQERQRQAMQEVTESIDERHAATIQDLTNSLRTLFEEMAGQQSVRLSELGQRLERGLSSLGGTIDHLKQPQATASLPTEFRATAGDGDAAGSAGNGEGRPGMVPLPDDSLLEAVRLQTQELLKTRTAMESLAKSLEHLATLEPFQNVMSNIDKALGALLPAIDELKKPRELRVIDAYVTPGEKTP